MKLTKRTDLLDQFHATHLPVPLELDSVGGQDAEDPSPPWRVRETGQTLVGQGWMSGPAMRLIKVSLKDIAK